MQATQFGSWKRIEFNSRDILYIVEDGFKCDTHFIDGETVTLQWGDMENLLNKLPKVFCYKHNCVVYINPNEMNSYLSNGSFVTVKFRNGRQLKELSVVDFERNVIPKLNREHEREF